MGYGSLMVLVLFASVVSSSECTCDPEIHSRRVCLQAALEFHSLCFAAGLMNQQCTSSTLRTLQLAMIWHAAIGHIERMPGRDGALVSNLLQTTAAECVARCFAASDQSAALICQLCEIRRHVIGRLKARSVFLACQRQCSFQRGWRSPHAVHL